MASGRVDARRGRYPTIDVLRGLALCSMVTTHTEAFTRKTLLWHAFHVQHWIDGACLFVALSGMVTGIVHRRVVERDGLGAPLVRPLRTVGIVGSKGLPGFATMVLAILALDLAPSVPRSDPVNLVVMVLCGCAEYVALRRQGYIRRRAAPAAEHSRASDRLQGIESRRSGDSSSTQSPMLRSSTRTGSIGPERREPHPHAPGGARGGALTSSLGG